MADPVDAIRIDKWLWVARFFKTRKLATEAITGGKVHVNGQRCKPGKDITVGTEIVINKSGYSWVITVTSLTIQRRSAKEAVLLFEETAESKAKRQQQIQEERERKDLFGVTDVSHKPNKKDRRLIHRFKQNV